jgi:hypothetical protein
MNIEQYGDTRYLKECPKCHINDETGFDYGDIDTPPILVQLDDQKNHRTRVWKARRCHCANCQHIWDVVLEDQVTGGAT